MLKEVRRFRKKWYADAHAAKERGDKIAWNMYDCGFADAITTAFDVVSVWPENFGGICTFKNVHKLFLNAAESEGFFLETCGYARVAFGLGHHYKKSGTAPPEAPEGGLPPPDLLIGHTRHCDTRSRIMEIVKRYWPDVPAFCLGHDYPPTDADFEYIKPYYLKFYRDELKRYIAWLEEHTGKKLDWDRLKHQVRLNFDVLNLYCEIFELRKAKPCPMSCLDNFTVAPFALFFPADEDTLDFFIRLRDELREKVEKKIGAIPEEKYRLLWGIPPPPWYAMPIFSYMESLGAVFINEIGYYMGPPGGVDVDDPLEALALREWERYINAEGLWGPKVPELFAKRIEDGDLDGVVVAMTPSCRMAVGAIYQIEEAEKILGRKIPTLFIEADMVDESSYSEVMTKAKIDAFLETVDADKRARGKA